MLPHCTEGVKSTQVAAPQFGGNRPLGPNCAWAGQSFVCVIHVSRAFSRLSRVIWAPEEVDWRHAMGQALLFLVVDLHRNSGQVAYLRRRVSGTVSTFMCWPSGRFGNQLDIAHNQLAHPMCQGLGSLCVRPLDHGEGLHLPARADRVDRGSCSSKSEPFQANADECSSCHLAGECFPGSTPPYRPYAARRRLPRFPDPDESGLHRTVFPLPGTGGSSDGDDPRKYAEARPDRKSTVLSRNPGDLDRVYSVFHRRLLTRRDALLKPYSTLNSDSLTILKQTESGPMELLPRYSLLSHHRSLRRLFHSKISLQHPQQF